MFEENDRLGSFCLFSRCISLVFLLRRCFRMFQVYFLGPNTSSQGVWKPRVCFLRRRYLRILNLARKCMGLLVFRFKWVFGICLGSRSFIQRDWRMFAEGMSVWQPFSVLDILVCEPQRSYPPFMLAKSFRFQIFVTTSVPHVPQPPNNGHPFLRCFNLSCVGILYPFGWKVKKSQTLLTWTYFDELTIHQVLRETTTNITLPEDCGVSQDLPVLAFHSSHCWPVHVVHR